MRLTIAAFAVCVASLISVDGVGPADDHQQPTPQAPVFRSGVELVQLDVSVLDKNRQPVRGLTAADFTVFEDGAPQPIAAFNAIDLPDVVAPAAKWANTVAADVTTNEIENQRIFVIVLDDSTGPSDLWAIEAMKRSAIGIIDRLGQNDLAAVIFTLNNRNAQNLTSDHAKLTKAVKTLSNLGGGRLPCVNSYNTANTIASAAEYLAGAGIPQRRKTLVFLGGAVPPLVGLHDPCGVIARMREGLRAAQQGNVNIYPIDACGLRLEGPMTGGCGAGAIASLRDLAENTGGKALINTNDFMPGITQMFRENGSFYLLGYRPANVIADGKFRRVEVKVARPDVQVWTRKHYIAPKPPPVAGAAAARPPADLDVIANILPNPAVPLRVVAAPFAVPGAQTAAVTLAVGLKQPLRRDRFVEELDLKIRAFTPEGDPRGEAEHHVSLTVPAAFAGTDVTRYEALGRIDLKPGRYELRLSVQSGDLDKRGSVYVDVEIPDFNKLALSMSGVVLESRLGVPAAPADAFSDIVPAIPTTERTFSRADRVSAFLRVYQGGRNALSPVRTMIRVLDAQGAAVIERTETLGADRFGATRASDLRVDLPLAQLAPGSYLLSIETTMGKAKAAREVKLTMK